MGFDHGVQPVVAGCDLGVENVHASDAYGVPTSEPITSIDRTTVAYIVAAQADFDTLRQTAGQLAGLLVLAACGARAISPEHSVLEAATAAYARVAPHLRAMTVPTQARHLHHHLLQALDLLDVALQRCKRDIATYTKDRRDVDRALTPLQSGYRHLQQAAGLLPGFELVAFGQGCCASHPAVLNTSSTFDSNALRGM